MKHIQVTKGTRVLKSKLAVTTFITSMNILSYKIIQITRNLNSQSQNIL